MVNRCSVDDGIVVLVFGGLLGGVTGASFFEHWSSPHARLVEMIGAHPGGVASFQPTPDKPRREFTG